MQINITKEDLSKYLDDWYHGYGRAFEYLSDRELVEHYDSIEQKPVDMFSMIDLLTKLSRLCIVLRGAKNSLVEGTWESGHADMYKDTVEKYRAYIDKLPDIEKQCKELRQDLLTLYEKGFNSSQDSEVAMDFARLYLFEYFASGYDGGQTEEEYVAEQIAIMQKSIGSPVLREAIYELNDLARLHTDLAKDGVNSEISYHSINGYDISNLAKFLQLLDDITKHPDEYQEKLARLQDVFDEKLVLSVSEFMELKPFTEFVYILGLAQEKHGKSLECVGEYKDVAPLVEKCQEMGRQFDQKLQAQAKQVFVTGDMLAMFDKHGDYYHAALASNLDDENCKVFELMDQVVKCENMNLFSSVQSHVYRIKLEKLVKPEFKTELMRCLGVVTEEALSKVMQSDYAKLISTVMKEALELSEISHIPVRYEGEIGPDQLQDPRDWADGVLGKTGEEFEKAFYGLLQKPKVSCVEFIMRTQMLGLRQLERDYADKLKLDAGTELLNLPFSKWTPFEQFGTAEWVDAYRELDALERIDDLPIVKQLTGIEEDIA